MGSWRGGGAGKWMGGGGTSEAGRRSSGGRGGGRSSDGAGPAVWHSVVAVVEADEGCEGVEGPPESGTDDRSRSVFLAGGSVVWGVSSMLALRSSLSINEGDRPDISSLRSLSICAGDMDAMRRRFSSSMDLFSSSRDGGAVRRCLKADGPVLFR